LRQRCPERFEDGGSVVEIAAIGLKRVVGGSALRAHHFEEGLGVGGAQIAHDGRGSF